MRTFALSDSGQDLVEYALIIAVVALALVASVSSLSTAITGLYGSITGRITGVDWVEARW